MNDNPTIKPKAPIVKGSPNDGRAWIINTLHHVATYLEGRRLGPHARAVRLAIQVIQEQKQEIKSLKERLKNGK